MANAMRPNAQMSLPGLGVPIDPLTGELIKPAVLVRLTRLKDAEMIFRELLHELDGTTMGSRPGDRRMSLAFTKLEEACMWAQAAVLDHYGG